MNDGLINKYRPGTFKEVIGQDTVVRSLEAAIKRKAGQSFLFVGPSGCGKTTLARIAAKALGCSSLDLIESDAATNTGIDDVRQLTRDIGYLPIGADAKGIIVDEIHALSKNAITSLLKSTEEPPAHMFWFLCTNEAGKIPVVLKRRCLTYELKLVAPSVLTAFLERIADKEKSKVGNDVIDLCVKNANGSPGQALANLAVCLDVKSREEAAELLTSAEASPQVIDFCRALYKGAAWRQLQIMLVKMTEANAESIRQVVRAYGTKVALGAKNPADAGRALEILDCFSTPCYGSDGITPILLACARLTLMGSKDDDD